MTITVTVASGGVTELANEEYAIDVAVERDVVEELVIVELILLDEVEVRVAVLLDFGGLVTSMVFVLSSMMVTVAGGGCDGCADVDVVEPPSTLTIA